MDSSTHRHRCHKIPHDSLIQGVFGVNGGSRYKHIFSAKSGNNPGNMKWAWFPVSICFNHIILFLFHPGGLWQIHAFWDTRSDHQSELLHGVGSAVGCGSEASVSFLHTSSPPFSCRGQGNVWAKSPVPIESLGFGSNFHPSGFFVYWVIVFRNDRNGNHAILDTQ